MSEPEPFSSASNSIPILLPILPSRDRRYRHCALRKKSSLFVNLRYGKSVLGSFFFCGNAMWLSKLKSVRWATLVLGVSNLVVTVIGASLVVLANSDCGSGALLGFVFVSVVAAIRILSMIGIGIAQEATASTILSSPTESSAIDAVMRHERRMRYKRWLWWTRFGLVVTVLQFVGATYLIFIIMKYVSYDGKSDCFSGVDVDGNGWSRYLLVVLVVLVWFLIIGQCLMGSDVLRWRSFYATHDNAWKAHYQEVFDHGIREFLCCLGRVKYLSTLEEDEVYSVARLLGDLVAYRASGTGHLELLAGLALLQRHKQSKNLNGDFMEAPELQIQEAAVFHPFAEAAYTGPLLDFGRNPILFPCAWLYRQGVLTPWTRHRRPVLEGDNWWRGHAAAFLKYSNLSPEALLRGRVSQAKCEAAYFIVVLHHLRSLVIAVRGTETPEDLITDGLCRECKLSAEDLDGLINSNHVHPNVKQSIISSFPHYGHSGIVEAARELFMQVDGRTSDKDSPHNSIGFLSSLLGNGCECQGYNVRIVGHSLGGAIGTLLGIRGAGARSYPLISSYINEVTNFALYRRYPNLHVYSYGPLPCVDSIVAEACSDFVTSIVYNDEFSSRLSVNSIMRLRAAAITALSQDSSANSAMICKLARRVLQISKYYLNQEEALPAPESRSRTVTTEYGNHQTYIRKNYKYTIKGDDAQHQVFHPPEVAEVSDSCDVPILEDSVTELHHPDTPSSLSDPCFITTIDVLSCEDPVSEFMDHVPSTNGASQGDPPEMFLPGLIVHIVPQQRTSLPLWKSWGFNVENGYKAYIANRDDFKDITVSPYMFLDHLPWRVHHALQKVLRTRHAPVELSESLMV